MDEHKELIRRNILDEGRFVRAVFSGRQRGQVVPWNRVVLRPVLIRGERHVQFSYFTARKDVSKNYTGTEIADRLDELLALPFSSIHVQTTHQSLGIQVSKRGKVILHRHDETAPKTPSLEHDRRKDLLLPAGQADPFLQKLGIMTQTGRIRRGMQKKFRQINEFLRLIVETGELQEIEQSPLDVVDCGCGNAYLTFAVHYYLNNVLGRPTRVVGIDVSEDLLNRRAELCKDLGWEGLSFQATRIADYRPPTPPGIVLALHACDTATDEALAQAVRWESRMLFAAPCCHHHLQRQMTRTAAPPPLRPLLRHNVFKERLGDLLTDSFRALILRMMGYRTDVVEFVSTEHTAKNLLIRAVRSAPPGNRQAVREYRGLRASWSVRPYLEQLLEEELSPMIGDSGPLSG